MLADLRELIKLGKVNPKKLTKRQTELIQSIAENSTQYEYSSQVVLGKWVDHGSGFAKIAQDTDSVHYYPHPEFWELIKEFGEEKDTVAWLVNQQVLQTAIKKDLPFEYALDGINFAIHRITPAKALTCWR